MRFRGPACFYRNMMSCMTLLTWLYYVEYEGGGGSIKINKSVEGFVPYRKVMAKISFAKIKLCNDKYNYIQCVRFKRATIGNA